MGHIFLSGQNQCHVTGVKKSYSGLTFHLAPKKVSWLVGGGWKVTLVSVCVCVSKSLRKWTQTDTKVTFHPPTRKLFLISNERYGKNKTFLLRWYGIDFAPIKRYCPFCFLWLYIRRQRFSLCDVSQISVFMSVLLSVSHSVCFSVCPSSFCPSVFPSVCLTVLLSVCLRVLTNFYIKMKMLIF